MKLWEKGQIVVLLIRSWCAKNTVLSGVILPFLKFYNEYCSDNKNPLDRFYRMNIYFQYDNQIKNF